MKKMMCIKQLLRLQIIVCMMLCYGCPPPTPKEYNYMKLLPPGWQESYVGGINDKGVVVGGGKDGAGVDKSFIYSGGEYTELLPLSWVNAGACDINNNGEVIFP